jgi:hypothetical protein
VSSGPPDDEFWTKLARENGCDPVAMLRIVAAGEQAAMIQLPSQSSGGRQLFQVYLGTMERLRQEQLAQDRAIDLANQARSVAAAEQSANAARGANKRADQARTLSAWALGVSVAALIASVVIALMGGGK